MNSDVPPYMNKGSRGPHVTLIHALLFGMDRGDGIVMDQDYGDTTAERVADVQDDFGLDADGNFGPKTRERVKLVCGFNFEAACLTVPGKTRFVQPDGTVIEWGPTTEEAAKAAPEKGWPSQR